MPVLAAETELPHRWSSQVEMMSRYDDNITELSDGDRTRVGTPACEASPSCVDRFRIESPDDFILAPSGRLEWSNETAHHIKTSVRGEIRASFYARNSIKNYQTYGLRLSQDLTPARKYKTVLILRGNVLPDFYLRELTVPEASRLQGQTVRDSARFSSLDASAAVRQVLVPKFLELEVLAGRDRRDYDAAFDERDGDLKIHVADLTWHLLGNRAVDLRVGYRSEEYDAEGDRSSTLAFEPDISSDRSAVSLGMDLKWGTRVRRGGISLDLEREERDFLSDDPVDTFHFDRQDRRTEASLALRLGLGRVLQLEGGLTHEKNDSDLGPGAVSSSGDEVTDYTRDVLSVSIGWRF
jgi:hypothetical protein